MVMTALKYRAEGSDVCTDDGVSFTAKDNTEARYAADLLNGYLQQVMFLENSIRNALVPAPTSFWGRVGDKISSTFDLACKWEELLVAGSIGTLVGVSVTLLFITIALMAKTGVVDLVRSLY